MYLEERTGQIQIPGGEDIAVLILYAILYIFNILYIVCKFGLFNSFWLPRPQRIPGLFIRFLSVLGLIPGRSAAPPGP
jgi:hypothetical protein